MVREGRGGVSKPRKGDGLPGEGRQDLRDGGVRARDDF